MIYICRNCANKHGFKNIESWDDMPYIFGDCDLYIFENSCRSYNSIVFPLNKFKYKFFFHEKIKLFIFKLVGKYD